MKKIEIMEAVNKQKPCSDAQLRRYIKSLGIKPLGECKTRPLRYPEDSAVRILTHLGFAPVNGVPVQSAYAPAEKVVSLKKLQNVRQASRRGK